jgi:hypothetical protein
MGRIKHLTLESGHTGAELCTDKTLEGTMVRLILAGLIAFSLALPAFAADEGNKPNAGTGRAPQSARRQAMRLARGMRALARPRAPLWATMRRRRQSTRTTPSRAA